MTSEAPLDLLVALVGRRPGLRKQQLCDALDLPDETVTNLLANALLGGRITSKDTPSRNGLVLPEYHAIPPGALNWGSTLIDAAPATSTKTDAAPMQAAPTADQSPMGCPRPARTMSREAEAIGFLEKHGPATALQLREAMGIKDYRSVRSFLGRAIDDGRVLVLDDVYSLGAHGGELVNACSSSVGDHVAHLASPPSAVSPLGGAGELGVKDNQVQDLPLTWSIFADGQVGIFIKQGTALQQLLFLSQADVVGLYSFLSQTKPVWNLLQPKEPV
ncbi:MAG: hypothetical protein GAK35_02753 [Herbaspirillum frisingense]|uniref:Uncharacterized protein n=1 Tax=Herbaspirillum frisingense TaxID=92645 RepID=A0A7V8JTH3_9BURK|nr:MAG: hypothetical protein GAK35_02753 [Herbaspirillum frisingense]